MDSNVSKNTFSHKFFKLQFTKGKAAISLKYLLKQELLQSIDLYRHQAKIELDLESLDELLERKIIPFQPARDKLESQNQRDDFFSKSQIRNIGYSCPIAFTLSPYFLLPTQIIAENLRDLLVLKNSNAIDQSFLPLKIEIVTLGRLNFYLEPLSIATWLSIQSEIRAQLSKIASDKYELETSQGNLFSVQYVHARCYCLLRLIAREELIVLKDEAFNDSAWQLSTRARLWLNKQQNLCFTSETEYGLLRQLLIVSDSFAEKSCNWAKLALNFSTAVAVFLTECRFLGEVRQQNPQIAIARRELIALSQYWLQRILLEKLKIAAPVGL